MTDTTILRSPSETDASIRRQVPLVAALPMVLLTGCVDGRTAFEVVAAIVVFALVVKLPWLCLAYACLTGLWIAGFGPYSVLQSGIFSGAPLPLGISVRALTPFLVINEAVSLFCLGYAWLVVKGIPWGGCGTLLAVAALFVTTISTGLGVGILGSGAALGSCCIVIYLSAGLSMATAALRALLNPQRRTFLPLDELRDEGVS